MSKFEHDNDCPVYGDNPVDDTPCRCNGGLAYAIIKKKESSDPKVQDLETENAALRKQVEELEQDCGAAAWILEWMTADKFRKPAVPTLIEKARRHYQDTLKRAEKAEANVEAIQGVVDDIIECHVIQQYAGANRECVFCGQIDHRISGLTHNADCLVLKAKAVNALDESAEPT